MALRDLQKEDFLIINSVNCRPVDEIKDVKELKLTLKINHKTKQTGLISQMLFPVEELIHYISRFFTLLPGDLILTGTPSGVGPLNSGDIVEAEINNVAHIKTSVI